MKISALFLDVFIFLRIEKLWNKDSFCGTNVRIQKQRNTDFFVERI